MTTTDYLTNDSTPKQLCEFLRTQKSESPLLIGHEPFLSEMLSLLIGDIRHAQIEMHCCSLALVKMESSLHYGSGVLEMLVHPGLLRPWLKQ
jgi:phosphohistidine phosphatase SixA